MIRRIALAAALGLWAFSASAEITSYRVAHPVGWMYSLPAGETPGWSSPSWFNLELNHANVWNMEFNMSDRRTGDVYTFKADYEQSSAILNTGFAVGRFALGVEVPYANHNGGFLDDFIDQFHIFGRFDRFMREINGKFGNSFVIRTNGEDRLASEHAEGVGNVKAKLKWWALPWRSPTPGACDCGFALSAHGKFPVQPRSRGLTSGAPDFSGLAHLGVPLGSYSGVWATAGVTKLGYNETFAGWPQRRWQQMYELVISLGINRNVALVLTGRTESPLFEQKYLEFDHRYADEAGQQAEREASGWTGLTEWRGSQTAGIVWRWGKGSQAGFSIMEDWGLGDRDSGSWNYVNGAPDVAFVTQLHFVF